MRLHAAVQGARGAAEEIPREGLRRAGLPVQPVRRAGAGQRSGDRDVLRDELRRDVPDVREGRRERRRGLAGVPVAQEGEAGPARQRGDQVELHEVPRRPEGQGRRRATRPTTRPSRSPPTSRSCCDASPRHPRRGDRAGARRAAPCAARHGQGDARVVSHGRDRASTRRPRATSTATPSTASSSTRCTSTTTWRGR